VSVGLSVSQCLSPPHHKQTLLSFNPDQITGLDIQAVSGAIYVRSCRFATNVTITVKEAAQSASLLQDMTIQSEIRDKTLHLTSLSPLDLTSCQFSHITITIPTALTLSINAHVTIGHISIGPELALFNANLSTSIGYIHLNHIIVEQTLNLYSTIGYSHIESIQSNISNIEIEVGFFKSNSFVSQSASISVGVGAMQNKILNVQNELELYCFLGEINSKLQISVAKSIRAEIQYGILTIRPVGSFKFDIRSVVGSVEVHQIDKSEEILFLISAEKHSMGYFGGTKGVVQNVEMQTNFGRASLVTGYADNSNRMID